jgi:hypothetical protein
MEDSLGAYIEISSVYRTEKDSCSLRSVKTYSLAEVQVLARKLASASGGLKK